MRRVALFAVFLSLLGLTTAVAASFSVNAEDVASFSTDVTVTTLPPPGQAHTFYLKGSAPTLPGFLDPVLDANEPVRSKTIVNDASVALQDQADTTKYHTWQTLPAPAGGLIVNGTVRLFITQNGNTNVLTAGLFDCAAADPASSSTCTRLGADATNPGTEGAGFKERIVSFGSVVGTIAQGRVLRLKVVNRSATAWEIQWGYLAARQARLEIVP